jgi:hypothetical protein
VGGEIRRRMARTSSFKIRYKRGKERERMSERKQETERE